jgi:hypothetical protein
MPDLAETADVVVVGGSTAGAVPAVRPPGSGVTRWRPLHGSTPGAFPGWPRRVPAQHCLIQCGGTGCCGLEPVEVVEVTPGELVIALDDLRGLSAPA